MRTIPLSATPNQRLSVRLDDTRIVLTLKDTGGAMVADLERAGVLILSGSRVLAGEPIIPYRYIEEGNFIVLTVGDVLPDWREFGISQRLIYITKAEVDALHG